MFYFLFFTQYYFQNFWKKIFGIFCQKLGKFHRDYFANQYPDGYESVDSVRLTVLTYVWSVRLTNKKSCRDIFPYSHTRIQM